MAAKDKKEKSSITARYLEVSFWKNQIFLLEKSTTSYIDHTHIMSSTFLDPLDIAESMTAAIKWILISSSLCQQPEQDNTKNVDDLDLSTMLVNAAQTIMESTTNMLVYTSDMTMDAAEIVTNAMARVVYVYSTTTVKDIHRTSHHHPTRATTTAKASNKKLSSPKKLHWQESTVVHAY